MMTAFAAMAPREKILLLALCLVLVVGGYLFTRGAELNTQVLILDDQLTSMDKKLSKERKSTKSKALPELDGKSIRAKDVKKLERLIEEEQALLSGFAYVIKLKWPN